MSHTPESQARTNFASTHGIGVLCGLGAGVWLGGAEAPTKLVNSGLSPYAISFCMVAGVFTARWTVPTLLKGTRQVFADLAEHKQLLPVAILAGMLWAVANTLTVFAIRDVGLAIAFPLWNTNSLVGILWGRLLFGELKGASPKNIAKVVLGALAIVLAAILLGFSTIHGGGAHPGRAAGGILAAAGASLVWGTMYIPYRKAYISGMNPLSFVTVFTIGELGAVLTLAWALDPGSIAIVLHSPQFRPMLFWLFLGGFVWVIGDIFQQYATKYLGIGRGIPLSNTNQLWGLAWGALVFGELAHADAAHRLYVIAGSIVMILGALAVSTAVATEREHSSTTQALERECDRYGLDYTRVLQAYSGSASGEAKLSRAWWDYLILAAATGVFIWLGVQAQVPSLAMNFAWVAVLSAILIVTAVFCGWSLWRATRFS
ncbi:MAG TPA: GRP family sugar transporter [Terracidiphilus sp.]|jgi:glucose uptake protein GlcU|nr:GRP family sugar transporter [Terracidiphilus sp.]